MTANSTTDPFEQSFTLVSPGDGPFNVSLSDLNDFNLYNIEICINYGAQIGASIAVLLVLLLLTRPDRRLSAILIVNTLSLIFNIIRNVLQCVRFTGPWTNTYAFFADDFSRVHTKDYAIPITTTVFTLLMQICVEASLCMQVRVVCVTLRELYRRVIFAISGVVALLAIGFRFAYMVENDKYIVALVPTANLYWLGSATNITTSISIFWFCGVFVTKLGFALYQRKKLGIGQFGPMQILFIMGCQTLIIPAVLSILQYWVNPAMSSNALTAVAIFLPLSSLWASASIDSRTSASKESRKVFANYPSGFSEPTTYRQTPSGPVSPAHTATTLRGSDSRSNPSSPGQHQFYSDLEKQGLAGNGDLITVKE
ncbi:MAG: hypothetical protein Q9217_004026 [Psora testacea]